MARSKAEVYAELAALAHHIFTDTPQGRAILNALAAILAQAAAAWDGAAGWLAQLRRATASGDWLDLHGAMHGQAREGGEDDEAYRARAVFAPQGLTVDEAQRLADRQLAHQGDGYSAVLVEPYGCVLDEGMYLDTATSILTAPLDDEDRPRLLAWMHLPVPEVAQPFGDGAFLDEGAYLDARCQLGEDITSLERPFILRILEQLDARRVLGVAVGVSVRDFFQDAFAEALLAEL